MFLSPTTTSEASGPKLRANPSHGHTVPTSVVEVVPEDA